MLRCMGHTYIHHLFLKVSYGMDKRRRVCCLEHKIPFCCINHVTKSGNINASANAAAILTPTIHVAIRRLLVTYPFKNMELFLFPVTTFIHHSACLLRYQID